MQDNADEGIQVSQNTTAEVSDARLLRNGEWGIVAFANASIIFHGRIVSQKNGRSGIGIFRNSDAAAFDGVTIEAHHNARHGIIVSAFATLFANRGVFKITNNAAHGVLVKVVSSLFSGDGATFPVKQNKRAGLKVDDGSNVYMTKSNLTDNGTDVSLSFEARATLTKNTIGSITCDKSSRIRGDVVCPK